MGSEVESGRGKVVFRPRRHGGRHQIPDRYQVGYLFPTPIHETARQLFLFHSYTECKTMAGGFITLQIVVVGESLLVFTGHFTTTAIIIKLYRQNRNILEIALVMILVMRSDSMSTIGTSMGTWLDLHTTVGIAILSDGVLSWERQSEVTHR